MGRPYPSGTSPTPLAYAVPPRTGAAVPGGYVTGEQTRRPPPSEHRGGCSARQEALSQHVRHRPALDPRAVSEEGPGDVARHARLRCRGVRRGGACAPHRLRLAEALLREGG